MKTRSSVRVLAAVSAAALVVAACGGDDDDAAEPDTTSAETTPGSAPSSEPGETIGTTATTAPDGSAAPETTAAEVPEECVAEATPAPEEAAPEFEAPAPSAGSDAFIDGGTFVGDPPEHVDPALNSTLDAYQVINAVYDGLTDIDSSDPANPVIVPHVADEISANDDASVWTFHIREGAQFASGEEINASTFKRSWERAATLAGDYSYLISGFIQCGTEFMDGAVDGINGVVADDDTRTLTVTLTAPYSNFDAVAGFQLFMPVPQQAFEAEGDWENGVMFGNGPYAFASARTDEEITLVRNESWQGDYSGDTWDGRLESIVFRTMADPDTGYNAFEAGETDNANIPPARVSEAQENWGTTLDVDILGSYHYDFNDRDPRVGGPENLKLRQAISLAIDREEINEAVYNGSRNTSTGVTPSGIPGFAPDLCEYCMYDPERAQELFDEWQAEGGVQDEPIPIQFNADAGHEPVVQIVVDNLAAIGIQAEAAPMPSETYFSEIADGACTFCRTGWFADYPTYDNFMYDLYHSDSIGGNNHGFINEEFDALVDQAKQTVDKDEQADLFQQAERILLNDATGMVPINWYRGDYAFDPARVEGFTQSNFGLIPWEQLVLLGG